MFVAIALLSSLSAVLAQPPLSPPSWSGDHADLANSGQGLLFTNTPGGGVGYGYCAESVISSTDPNTPVYSAGVVSNVDGSMLFLGNSANEVKFISTLVRPWTVALTLTLSAFGAVPVTSDGVVAAGSTANINVTASDGSVTNTTALFMPSADGHVYMLFPDSCSSQADFDVAKEALVRRGRGAEVDLQAWERGRLQRGLGAAPVPGVPCLAKTFNDTQNRPVYAAPKWVPFYGWGGAAKGSFPRGLLLACWTDQNLDANGQLFAFDVDTMTSPWEATPLLSAGCRYTPAVDAVNRDPATNALLFITYLGIGTTVYGFNPATGDNSLNGGADPAVLDITTIPGLGTDTVASSPALSADGSILYIHLASGNVLAMTTNAKSAYLQLDGVVDNIMGVTLSPLFVCLFEAIDWDCVLNPTADAVARLGLVPPAVDPHLPAGMQALRNTTRSRAAASKKGRPAPTRASRTAAGPPPPSSIVPGGFYQPTTLLQREELWTAISARYTELAEAAQVTAASFSAAAPALLSNSPLPLPHPFSSALVRRALSTLTIDDVVGMAGVLGHAELARLITPSGYRMLSRSGRPASDILDAAAEIGRVGSTGYGGVYPFSTPALSTDNFAYILLTQWAPYPDDQGVYLLDPVYGYPEAEFDVEFDPDGFVLFGRSLSSPAIDQSPEDEADGRFGPFNYVASDADTYIDGVSTTRPVLFVFDGFMDIVWTYAPLPSPFNVSGANVALLSDAAGLGWAVFVTSGSVTGLSASTSSGAVAQSCPSTLEWLPCSGAGSCDCNTGTCTCTGSDLTCTDLSTCGPLDCGPGGTCVGGTCECGSCYSKDEDGLCTIECNGNGVCDAGTW